MKYFLSAFITITCSFCHAQTYVLVDKKMSLPVIYANTLSVQDNFHGYFPIEKTKVKDFITKVEKIAQLLGDPKKKKPEKIEFALGSTTFHGIRVPLSVEERLDIVLTTEYGKSKSTMHLSDAKISNASNAFFINTWIKYLRSYITEH